MKITFAALLRNIANWLDPMVATITPAVCEILVNDIEREKCVRDITETEFFRDLQSKAAALRAANQA